MNQDPQFEFNEDSDYYDIRAEVCSILNLDINTTDEYIFEAICSLLYPNINPYDILNAMEKRFKFIATRRIGYINEISWEDIKFEYQTRFESYPTLVSVCVLLQLNKFTISWKQVNVFINHLRREVNKIK